MIGSSVLSGGQRHRRRRGRPRPGGQRRRGPRPSRRLPLAAAGLIVVLGLAFLLVVLAGGASGPTLPSGAKARASTRRPTRAPATVGPTVPAGYGVTPAPASERVHIHLLEPLRSGLLFNVRTGQVLWDRDPDLVVPIASLTKMMTALIVATLDPLKASVLITRQAVDFSGSGVGLLPLHKRVPLEPLLYGLLLPSGNDAAIALAQHVAGTQRRFIAMMNARAQAMGLPCTHYTTVSGVVDAGNHSCAVDLAKLAGAVLEVPRLARIVGSASAILPFPIKGHKLYLYNNNPLYKLGYPGTDGVKTGYTTAAGVCLVATARRGRSWVGVVLLHSADEDDQAPDLLNAGFAALRRTSRP
jgi:serine-type D-Ala-D-Ala carboxypeptidase (penicillin-binding protein 5/6)